MYIDYHIYIFVARIPRINPKTFPIDAVLPLYSLFDSGISSPETKYIIAPAANARHRLISHVLISPYYCSK